MELSTCLWRPKRSSPKGADQTFATTIRDDNTFSVPERWFVPIRAIDFDATGTTVKLPFRPYSRFRDELQELRGQRLFPGKATPKW